MDFYEYKKLGDAIFSELEQCDKKIILYGTGSIGNYIGRVLEPLVAAYCVTNLMDDTSTFNGVPVFDIHALPYEPEASKIILTMDNRHWPAVNEQLLQKGYTDVVPASIEFQNALLSRFYDAFFSEHQVDLSRELILLKGSYLRNPIFLSEIDFKAVLIEMNDLVLGDIYADYSMWSEGPYLYKKIQLAEGDVVLDCGANLGLFSCVAASKDCQVHAFEPTPRLVENLEICSKQYPNIKVQPYALSDKSGYADLAMSSEWDVANTINPDAENTVLDVVGYKTYSKIETITIDEFVEKQGLQSVDFIKADIEGAERLMLAGAQKTLASFGPKLSICTYHFKDDPQVLEALILKGNPKYIIEHRWKKVYAYIDPSN